MATINDVHLCGRLGKDPELRRTRNDTAVVNMSVATDWGTKNEDGTWTNNTDWHRVKVWGKQAEWCEANLSKGDVVMVSGRLSYSQWDDKDTGKKMTMAEVIAIRVCSGGSSRPASSRQAPPVGDGGADPGFGDDDDIPF